MKRRVIVGFGAVLLAFACAAMDERELKALPAEKRDELIFAAAGELSLRTAEGEAITADVVDGLVYRSAKLDTPAEARLRALHFANDRRMSLFQSLSNDGLVKDARVIGPLIDMLEYPGKKTAIPNMALQVLGQVTGYAYVNLNYGDDREKWAALVGWWRAWWKENADKHPVLDAELEAAIVKRVGEVEMKIRDRVPGYGELQQLDPKQVRILHIQVGTLADQMVDTSIMGQLFIRTRADGTEHPASRKEDWVRVRVLARLATVPVGGYRAENVHSRLTAPVEEVYREVLPGTNVAVSVEAASEDEAFMKKIRECLKRPAE